MTHWQGASKRRESHLQGMSLSDNPAPVIPRKPKSPHGNRRYIVSNSTPSPRKYRYWTNKEEAFITEHWGKHAATDIAIALNRSHASVLKKASKLGLQSMRTVKTKHSLTRIKAMIDFGHHPTTIARTLNTSTKTVYNMVSDRLDDEWYFKLLKNVKRYNREITPIYRKD
jgi:hypothetical protein